ncbi:MAG TPA: transposase [Terriglobia bacterium]|nr:transposase [Terriglobia bacterium]
MARLVENALFFFDAARYHLHAWVVMPNHVHVLFTPEVGYTLSVILHSWKSFTASQANRLLGRYGRFWQEEYFDRYIRNQKHYLIVIDYIESNPVTAGLSGRKEDWPFSSAGWGARAGSAGIPARS